MAFVLAAFRGKLNLHLVRVAVRDAALGTSTVFIIVVGATMFTSLMGMSGVPRVMSAWMLSWGDDTLTLIIMISIVYLVLGCFIESIGIMLLTLPIIYPLLQSAGVDMIWFGIIVIKLLEIGMITPPVGMNCYVIGSSLRGIVDLATVFRGAMWFIGTDIITLSLLIAFPAISLWLPSVMM